MIFYFTGTGNSQYAAETIASKTNDKTICISEEMKRKDKTLKYSLKSGERLGFVFPIYAWAPPQIVLDFISKITIDFDEKPYVYAIATCGANVGNAFLNLDKHLANKKISLSSCFTLVMPNNYIIVGDVDSKEEQVKKLDHADQKLLGWAPQIIEKKEAIQDLVKGPLPWVMTNVINPLFNKNAIRSDKFHASGLCTQCGMCEKICPVDNISLKEGPVWDNHCIQCLACIHYCPVKAIDYGKSTQTKGRYTHPAIDRNGEQMRFDELAKEWDTESRSERARLISEAIRNALENKKFNRALEFGCGTGLITFSLHELFDQIDMVDSSKEMIEVTKDKIKTYQLNQVHAYHLDLTKESLGRSTYDVIYSSMVLHHVMDVEGLLNTLYGLLKPGGCLCIVDLDEEDGSFHQGYNDFIGHNGFKQETLKIQLESVGFTDVVSRTFYKGTKEDPKNATEYSLFIMKSLREF